MNGRAPNSIIYDKSERTLTIKWHSESVTLPAELLRIYSPSADTRKPGEDGPEFEAGKKNIGIRELTKTGNYAIKITFDDGHQNGIYSWSYLHKLAMNKKEYWEKYLISLKKAGRSRLPKIAVGQWAPKVAN
tara:strand:- start:25 stop:420 length:396 start_codon:yes stop_codon:yes gene_type:complete